MDAAVRRGLADGFLVRRAVDVNVASVRIHVDVAVETLVQAGFKAFEPQDARGDLGVRKFRLRRVADDLARFENRSRRFARADFFRDAMQSERRAIRAFRLPDAETRSGSGKHFYELEIFHAGMQRRGDVFKKGNRLSGDVDGEQKWRERDAMLCASARKILQISGMGHGFQATPVQFTC